LRKKYAADMQEHRLKREIIATQVTNSVVNRMGASFTLRMQEDTGSSPEAVARAYTIVKEVFRARDFWTRIEALDNKVSSELQTSALLAMWDLLRQGTRWLLSLQQTPLDIQYMVKRLSPGLEQLEQSINKAISPEDGALITQLMEPYLAGGVPRALARRIVMLPRLFPALDVVETAARRKTNVDRVAEVFYGLGSLLELRWLREQVEALNISGKWHAVSRANLRDELFTQHTNLVERVLQHSPRAKNPVGRWQEANADTLAPVLDMMAHMRSNEAMDFATLSVAVRALQQLVADTSP
jgi:glutamate dehydrogenase